ncbi:MAG: GAF domain-containing protein [Candidatus Schekmanbacteria bacterium]|nr:GAF domain-containing protein [Candidatus Schekmanbacteria bacterium]
MRSRGLVGWDDGGAAAVVPLHRLPAIGVLALVCGAAVVMSFAPGHLWGRWSYVNLPLHSAVEAFGAAAAIITAILLFERAPSEPISMTPASIGFLAMGVLDCFHAIAPQGQGFVFLHSAANLAGGLGFALCWLPPGALRPISARMPIIAWSVVLCGAIAALLVFAFDAVPPMFQDGVFTTTAAVINFTAGVLFLASALRFLAQFHQALRIDAFLVGYMAVLFGLSGLMFARSALWDDIWWSWHFVRLDAFLVLLWLVVSGHRLVIAQMRSALGERMLAESKLQEMNAGLEERVRERTAELRSALAIAERATARTEHLQSLTAALSEPLTAQKVRDVILRQGVATFGAQAAAIYDLVDRGEALELVAHVGHPLGLMAESRRFLHDARGPVTDAVRAGEPLFLNALATPCECNWESAGSDGGQGWLAAIPFLVDGSRAVGGMCLHARDPRDFGPEDRELLLAMGRQCGQALERARVFAAERQANELAREAIRAREELLAVVSHDLRSPLSSITLGVSCLEELLPECKDGEMVPVVTALRRSAAGMSRLIEDLLDAARIEAGRLAVTLKAQQVFPVVREAVEAVRLLAEQKALRLEERLAGHSPIARCDYQRLLQALANLLGNAIKFTPASGSVAIGVETVEGEVRFTVADTGPGISEQALPHVFDRYWQAGGSASAGAGLGLYIVKGIVEAHGGRIWVESRLGAGSAFLFTLPPALPSGEERAAATAGSFRASGLW